MHRQSFWQLPHSIHCSKEDQHAEQPACTQVTMMIMLEGSRRLLYDLLQSNLVRGITDCQ